MSKATKKKIKGNVSVKKENVSVKNKMYPIERKTYLIDVSANRVNFACFARFARS